MRGAGGTFILFIEGIVGRRKGRGGVDVVDLGRRVGVKLAVEGVRIVGG